MDYQKKLNFIMEYTRLRISQSVPKFIYEGEALALIDEIERLRQQNAELVEALQTISEWQPTSATQPRQKIIDNMQLYARLAIAKTTGVK